MPRGRPRKPTEELEARGAFEKNPQRKASRENEPKAEGPIGEPPAYFDENHCQIWHELIEECPKGVLHKSDRKHLELATRLTAKMRIVPGRMQRYLRNLGDILVDLGMSEHEVDALKEDFRAALGCSAQELGLLATTLTRMGMTPADRSKVSVPQEKTTDDPFTAIAKTLARAGAAKSVQ